MDSEEKTKELVANVKKYFPHLKMLVRASDRIDAYELLDAGADKVYRETLDTAVRMGTDALRMMGFRAYQTQRAAHTFLKHDERALLEFAKVRKDEKAYLTDARERMDDLEELIKSDAKDIPLERDAGWNPETLRKEAQAKGGHGDLH
jgi:voltage-gated potassium channel Kch